MTMTKLKSKLSLILCIVLIAAVALFTTACGDTNTVDGESTTEAEVTSVEEASAEVVSEVGQGATAFTFGVTYGDGATDYFTVHTDKTTVGEALLDAGLIEGEEGPYGLYIKTVNGVTADYDTDGTYWAFYVDGAYASTSADLTDISEGSVYELKVEK